MKLYRVTVRHHDGSIVKQAVFTKASSVHSFKGYWGGKGSWDVGSWHRKYTVTVETAFVNSWLPLDPNLERIENAIAAMPTLSAEDTSALIERLAANLAVKAA